MKEKKTIFKKPTVLATLKIPTADEVPYSPSYKRKTPRCLSLDLVEIGNLSPAEVLKPEGVLTNTKSKEKIFFNFEPTEIQQTQL